MLARGVGRDHRFAIPFGEPVAELLPIVGAVGDELTGRGNSPQESSCANQIVDLARRDREGERATALIGYGVNFGRPSAARSADGVDEGPPFAPAAERCALTWVESIAAEAMIPLEPVRA